MPVARAHLLGERTNLGHQHQVGDVLVDGRATAARPGFPSEGLDTLGVAAYEGDLDAAAGNLDRGRATDTTSSSGEKDECQGADLRQRDACEHSASIGAPGCPSAHGAARSISAERTPKAPSELMPGFGRPALSDWRVPSPTPLSRVGPARHPSSPLANQRSSGRSNK